MRRTRLLIAAAMLLGLCGFSSATPASATDDTAGPELVNFEISPTSVDTSAAAQTVTFTAHITDETGLSWAGISLESASGQWSHVSIGSENRTSGDARDGTYSATLQLKRYSPQGTWRVTQFSSADGASNYSAFDSDQLAARGLPNSFEQTGVGDSTAPEILSLDISPRSVDTSAAPQTVSITVRVTDDLAGVTNIFGSLHGASNQNRTIGFGPSNRISGDALDGTYRISVSLPRYSHQGTWAISNLFAHDAVQNVQYLDEDALSAQFSNTFEQTGAGDSVAPELANFDFTPRSVDVATAAKDIVFTARITDALSGAAYGQATLRGPSGQWMGVSLDSFQRVSGTAQDGTYRATLTVQRGMENGTWRITSVSMSDGVQNHREVSPDELAQAGFPTELLIKPASAPDAPTRVSAIPADASASVTWSAPLENGRSPITSYTVTAYRDGVAASSATTPNGVTTSATVGGLTNGQTYTFAVKATNAIGSSPDSAPSVPVVPRTVPSRPTGVTASPGDRMAVVNWTPAFDGGAPITSYTVSAYREGVLVVSQTLSGSSPSTTVSGLTNGVAYAFSVRATNVAGNSPESGQSAAVVPHRVPGAPSITSATAGNQSATISWNAPSDDGGSAITEYTVTAYQSGAAVRSVVVHHSSRSVTMSELTNGTDYVFTVTASNGAGAGQASAPSATVRPSALAGLPIALPIALPL